MANHNKFNFLIRTDASIKEGRSAHYYTIKPKVKKHIRKCGKESVWGSEMRTKSFISFYDDVTKAEMYSIETGLIAARERGLKRVLVTTDCKDIVSFVKGDVITKNESLNREVNIIKKLLKEVNGEISFMTRDNNKEADKGCRDVWVDSKMRFRNRKQRKRNLYR